MTKILVERRISYIGYEFQVTSKRDALDEKSTGARNDYLLALAAANAHQNRYFVVDLQSTMQVRLTKYKNK